MLQKGRCSPCHYTITKRDSTGHGRWGSHGCSQKGKPKRRNQGKLKQASDCNSTSPCSTQSLGTTSENPGTRGLMLGRASHRASTIPLLWEVRPATGFGCLQHQNWWTELLLSFSSQTQRTAPLGLHTYIKVNNYIENKTKSELVDQLFSTL